MSPRGSSEQGGREMYVGGLNIKTTESTLERYFQQYGEISQCSIKRDEDGRSRGFGFVLFHNVESLDNVLRDKKEKFNFVLDSCNIRVQQALPKVNTQMRNNECTNENRIFVSGLPTHGVTQSDVLKYFGRYGRVKEVILKERRDRSGLCGFGFVSFQHKESMTECLEKSVHEICFHICTVAKAEPRRRGARGYSRVGGKENREVVRGTYKAEDLEVLSRGRSDENFYLSSVAPSPSVNLAPMLSTSALSELALLLQASGNVLGSYVDRQSRLEERTDDLRACLNSAYSTREASSYGPVRCAYSARKETRTSRPYFSRAHSSSYR